MWCWTVCLFNWLLVCYYNYWFILSVSCNTDRHTASSIHNILLQWPQLTALKATNPPADHTLLDRLTSIILCNFLFQDMSCVMLSISSYKHPYVTPLTLSVTNQFHYQSSHCKAEPQSLLCCPSHPINILISLLSHYQLPINSITNHHTVKLNPSHCYAVHLIL